jgi:ParB family chromosome partitioning protein
MTREIERIGVEDIERLPGRRVVSPGTVDRLMESIQRIGLRTPLSVRVVDGFVTAGGEVIDGQPVLVTGAHRLEAVRRLGWDKVECFVLTDETEAQAKMWEIAENLHRAELSALERDEHIAEYDKLSEVVDAEKRAQVAQVSKGGRGKTGGKSQAARELGVKRDDVRRAVKVAGLTPEAKEAARELHLDDNRSALLAASKAAPEQQEEVIRKIADDKAERALLKPAKGPSLQQLVKEATTLPEWTAEHESAYAALCDAWEAAPDEARTQFLRQLPARWRSAA